MLKTVNLAVTMTGLDGLIGRTVQKLVIMEDKVGLVNVKQGLGCVRVVTQKAGGVTLTNVSQSGALGVYGLHAV
jgi:hypothetical protein